MKSHNLTVMNTAWFWPWNFAIFASVRNSHIGHNFPRVRANQAQIVTTFCFLTVFTVHRYFFQFHICTSLRKLRTPLRRHLEVFSFITPFAFPLHSTSFSLFPLVSIVILLSLFVLFIVLAFFFCVSWFLYLILHICMYTRPFHRDYTEEILFPFVFCTSHFISFHPAHIGTTLCNIPVTPSPSWNPTCTLRTPSHAYHKCHCFVLFRTRPAQCACINGSSTHSNDR